MLNAMRPDGLIIYTDGARLPMLTMVFHFQDGVRWRYLIILVGFREKERVEW